MTDWYLPGYKAGGPIRSIANLVQLVGQDIDFKIITSDRDHGELKPYSEVEMNVFQDVQGCRVMYCSPTHIMQNVRNEIQIWDPEFIYLNSLFSVDFSLRPLVYLWKMNLLPKVILAPRGMLGEGALHLKPFKKRAFITLFKSIGFSRKLRFHSTDQSESVSIVKVLGSATNVVEVTNVPSVFGGKASKKRSENTFLFVSRLSPKKNFEFLLSTLADAKLFDASLTAVGPSEASYLKHLERLSTELNVNFVGAKNPTEVGVELDRHDYFVLPTLNENFGHAIIEALAHGCPVIISDQTPWKDLEEQGAGWVVPLRDKEKWSEVMLKAKNLGPEEYTKMSSNALAYVKRKFDLEQLREQYLELFGAKD
ncbi:MAG: glycosyltransferase [Flavobacteriales bacterium]|nr:glycosyltransferase [Flavobacteriales bacterium]